MAIDAIRDKPAVPMLGVSLVEIRVNADQTVAIKKTIFGLTLTRLTHVWRPITVVRDEYMRWGMTSEDRAPKHPIGEGVATGYCDVIIPGPIAV